MPSTIDSDLAAMSNPKGPEEAKPYLLMKLPRELRDIIYAYAIPYSDDEHPIVIDDYFPKFRSSCRWIRNEVPSFFIKEPALLATSRQVRQETLPVFYGQTTFQHLAWNPFRVETFFDQLGMERCKMLRKVHLVLKLRNYRIRLLMMKCMGQRLEYMSERLGWDLKMDAIKFPARIKWVEGRCVYERWIPWVSIEEWEEVWEGPPLLS